jgi:hypothetical protein
LQWVVLEFGHEALEVRSGIVPLQPLNDVIVPFFTVSTVFFPEADKADVLYHSINLLLFLLLQTIEV